MQCPCFSKKSYEECCKPFHKDKAIPPTALDLMRSRYSAYALHDVDYIIKTTHPDNLDYTENRPMWAISLLQFCHSSTFWGLDILEFSEKNEEAFVTFFAHIKQGEKETSFQEKSRFLKIEGRWLYRSAV